MQEPIFHTVQEAARILRVDAATIYRSIRAGTFPAIRIRSRYVIPQPHYARWPPKRSAAAPV